MQLKSLDIEREPSVVSIIIWDLDTVFSRGSDQDPFTWQLGSATPHRARSDPPGLCPAAWLRHECHL